jgi:hypothetical protein
MAKLSEAAIGWPHSVQPSYGRYHLAPIKVLVEIWIVSRANLYTIPHIKAKCFQVVKVGDLLKLMVPYVEEVGPAL